MKQVATLLFLLALAATATAQVDRSEFERKREAMREQFEHQKGQARRQYDEAKKKAEADYAAFRQRANEEYAAALQQAWQQMGVQPAVPKPAEPAPPRPPKPVPDRMPSSIPLPQGEVVLPPVDLTPMPLPPIPEPEPSAPTMQFALYGTTCSVHADIEGLRFRLPSLEEKSIATAWAQLSQEKYDGLLHDALEQRERLHLGDWGYLQLLGRMSEQLQGQGSNEAVLLQMYLLAQSGYRVRIARQGDRLVLLVPFNRNIYNYSYTTIDGLRHYVLSDSKGGSIAVSNVGFPREKTANILMGRLPDFGKQASPPPRALPKEGMSGGTPRPLPKEGMSGGTPRPLPKEGMSGGGLRTLQAERFGMMKATVAVEQSLIDFLNDYPLSDAWDYYALAGLSDGVKATLYPALRSQLEDKSKRKAATMLLDFVQTAFDYATDQEQFGYERPLFGDESLYYPKNDCEDRSIFYSILVRDLLGLDVVLVHWPGHLATAVDFPDEVDGDYFTIDGCRYTVCDPTYIGAGVGETMPQFQGVSAKLVRL